MHPLFDRWKPVLFCLLLLTQSSSWANPFFVMDPGVRRMPGTLETRLEVIRGIGYSGISINDTTTSGIQAAVSAARKEKLRVYALYMGFELTTEGVKLPENYDAICRALSEHGALLWIYVHSKVYGPSDKPADLVAVPALQEAADRAARYKLPVALYHHRDYWIESFSDAIRVAGQVDRRNLGVSFNLCHSLYAGEENAIPQLLRSAGPRLIMVTLNGADRNAAGEGWDRLIQPIGFGDYDLGALLEELRAVEYEGPIGFQSFGIKMDPVECLKISMKNWRSLVN